MDYDVEMLRLYFNENNFSKERIQYLLEHNPFNADYSIWEKQTINNNKAYARNLRKNKLIKNDIPIQEISVHKNNSIGIYLSNDILYTPCSIRDNINNIKIKNRLVLIKGIYKNELEFLRKLQKMSNPFIIGICTKNKQYYKYVLKNYELFLKELKKCDLLEEENNDQLFLTLKSK